MKAAPGNVFQLVSVGEAGKVLVTFVVEAGNCRIVRDYEWGERTKVNCSREDGRRVWAELAKAGAYRPEELLRSVPS